LCIVYIVYIHDEERFYTIERLLLQRASKPPGTTARRWKRQTPNPKHQTSSKLQHPMYALSF
jgi:hypothetical protein